MKPLKQPRSAQRKLSIRLKKSQDLKEYEVSPVKKSKRSDQSPKRTASSPSRGDSSPEQVLEYEVSPVRNGNDRHLVTTLRLSRSPSKQDIEQRLKSPSIVQREADKLEFSPRKTRKASFEKVQSFSDCRMTSPTKLKLIRSPIKSPKAKDSVEDSKENILVHGETPETPEVKKISMKVHRKAGNNSFEIVNTDTDKAESPSKCCDKPESVQQPKSKSDKVSPATQKRLSVRMRKPSRIIKSSQKQKKTVIGQRSITQFFQTKESKEEKESKDSTEVEHVAVEKTETNGEESQEEVNSAPKSSHHGHRHNLIRKHKEKMAKKNRQKLKDDKKDTASKVSIETEEANVIKDKVQPNSNAQRKRGTGRLSRRRNGSVENIPKETKAEQDVTESNNDTSTPVPQKIEEKEKNKDKKERAPRRGRKRQTPETCETHKIEQPEENIPKETKAEQDITESKDDTSTPVPQKSEEKEEIKDKKESAPRRGRKRKTPETCETHKIEQPEANISEETKAEQDVTESKDDTSTRVPQKSEKEEKNDDQKESESRRERKRKTPETCETPKLERLVSKHCEENIPKEANSEQDITESNDNTSTPVPQKTEKEEKNKDKKASASRRERKRQTPETCETSKPEQPESKHCEQSSAEKVVESSKVQVAESNETKEPAQKRRRPRKSRDLNSSIELPCKERKTEETIGVELAESNDDQNETVRHTGQPKHQELSSLASDSKAEDQGTKTAGQEIIKQKDDDQKETGRKGGRPRKNQELSSLAADSKPEDKGTKTTGQEINEQKSDADTSTEITTEIPRKRGRPRKNPAVTPSSAPEVVNQAANSQNDTSLSEHRRRRRRTEQITATSETESKHTETDTGKCESIKIVITNAMQVAHVKTAEQSGKASEIDEDDPTSPDGRRSSRPRKLTSKMEVFKQFIAKKAKTVSPKKSADEVADEVVDVTTEEEEEQTERRLSGRSRKMPATMEGFVLGTGRKPYGSGHGATVAEGDTSLELSTTENTEKATELKGKQKRKRCENHVEAAVEEANALLDTLAHDRLDKCHYKPAGKVAADEDDVDVDVEEDDEEEEPEEDFDIKNDSDSSEDEEEDVGEKRKRGRPRLYPDGFVAHQRRQRERARQEKEVKREATQQADKQTNNSFSDTPKPKRGPGRPRRIETESSSVTKKASTPEHRQSRFVLPKKLADDYVDPSEVLQKEEKVGGVVKRKRRVMDVNYDDDDLMSKDSGEEEEEEEELQPQKKRVMCTPVRPQQDAKFLERMEARMLVGSPGWLRNHGHRTFNDSNMSLREKFIEDTRLYAENKKKFERDLRAFMSQHGKMIQKPPVWHGVGLNLFQLFMAVHDLGGSHKVSYSKKWLGMYREIFGPASSKVQTAHGLKTYYMKNILPYELYLNGEDYEEELEGARDLKSNSGVSLADSDESDCDDDDDEGSYMNDQASTISSSTQELMSELQVQASQASAYDILKEKVDMESSKMDLNIMFYDDLMAHQLSDPAFVAIQTTASEGELADMPDQTGGVPLDTLEMEATSAEPSSYVPEDDVMYELQVMGDPDTMSVEIEQSDLEAFAAGLKEAGFEEFEGKEEEKEQEVEDEYEDEEDETEEMGGEEEQEEEVEENVVQVGVEEALQYQQSMEMLTNLVGLDFDQL